MIYIDSEYRCHTTNPDGTFREVETDFSTANVRPLLRVFATMTARAMNRFIRGKIMTNWTTHSVSMKDRCLQTMNLHWQKSKRLWGCNT